LAQHVPRFTTIVVTGLGSASAKPDQAELRLGVSTKGATATEALTKNAESMGRIMEKIKAMEMVEEIETSRFSLRPDYSRMVEKLEGLIVDHVFRVTTTDLDKVGEIIDKAVETGANKVEMINYTFKRDTLEELSKRARQKAMSDAKAKAETIADSLGVEIVGISNAIEDTYPYTKGAPPPLASGVSPMIAPPTEKEIVVQIKVTFVTKSRNPN